MDAHERIKSTKLTLRRNYTQAKSCNIAHLKQANFRIACMSRRKAKEVNDDDDDDDDKGKKITERLN